MEAFYKDKHNTIYCLDFRKNDLPDECVQMVCTSPPYWGLRKYSGEQELIWGDNHCEHQWGDVIEIKGHHAGETNPGKEGYTKDAEQWSSNRGGFCSLCGAWKGAYGLEPTPELYISHTIEILREIRRVLRKDGVVFWNIGDSYWGSGRGYGSQQDPKWIARQDKYKHKPEKINHNILKPKDLCLIPFRLAIAAQEDGWWVRSVIIWSKPNSMPESVADRPTESHEYILMLTKSGTKQYWTHRDGGGTRQKPKADYRWVNQITEEEVAIEPPDWKVKIKCPECEGAGEVSVYLGLDVWQTTKCPTCNGKKETQLWKRINLWKGHDYYWDADAVREEYTEPMNRWGGETLKRDTSKTAGYKDMLNIGYSSAFRVGRPMRPNPSGRNIRSVWEFPTQPYPEAHFAVFPEKLPELCIKAATPEVGCCSKCGAPWERVTESRSIPTRQVQGDYKTRDPERHIQQNEIIGWQPTCKCNADKVPSIVLDPFSGVGTTLWEAKKLNRYAVGYEISGEYCRLIVDRCRQQVLL